MRIKRENDRLTLTADAFESRVLRLCLTELIQDYQVPADAIDPKTAQVWYSRRGCETARLSSEDTRDWVAQLSRERGERLVLMESWSRQLTPAAGQAARLEIALEKAPVFLMVINDRRLQSAAKHDLDRDEMGMADPAFLLKITPAQRRALFEMDFLGALMASLLRWLLEETENSGAPDA